MQGQHNRHRLNRESQRYAGAEYRIKGRRRFKRGGSTDITVSNNQHPVSLCLESLYDGNSCGVGEDRTDIIAGGITGEGSP